MRKVSEHGEHVYSEFIRRKVKLEYVCSSLSYMYIDPLLKQKIS